jgi:acyl-CoA synthetase (AMP-forming)/AMP-acid ligase II
MSDRVGFAGSGDSDEKDVARGDTPAPRSGCDWLDGVGTLSEVLRLRARQESQGDTFNFLFVNDDELPPNFPHPISPPGPGSDRSVAFGFRDAYAIARRAAHVLAENGVERGDKVLLVLPTGPAFHAAFWACQALGAVPVPAVPPYSLRTIDEYVARIVRLATNAHVRAVVTERRLVPVFKVARSKGPDARRAFSRVLLGQELLASTREIDEQPLPDPDDTALLQYTSGSTGNPKGVVLTHRNLLANVRAIGLGAAFRPGDVALAWLPLYHDMGLIGHMVAAHVWGMPLVLLPPEVFVKRPKEWLRAIDKYRGSCSASPNFGFSLCVKKVKDEEVESFDLSSWRVAFCGAEPISVETVNTFTRKFARARFHPGTFFPVYGMAELSLAATFPPVGRGPRFDRVDREAFQRQGRAMPAPADASPELVMSWVSVGRALPDHEVRVVDRRTGEVLPERQEGEVQVRGPSLMQGYYENPVATAEAIRDGWLRTGDLGYMVESELFVTGRIKEIIIKSGKNLYPQDIERAVAAVEGIRHGCVAAFGVRNDSRGTEELIVVAETKTPLEEMDEGDRERLATETKRAVLEAMGASPDLVLLVPSGTVPKTSSGKIQRDLTRKRYVAGELEPAAAKLSTLARLKIAQVVEGIRGFGRRS